VQPAIPIVDLIEANAIAPVHANYRSSVETLPLGVIADRQRDPRDIVAYAHARGVIAEAELGTLGGIEDVAGEVAAIDADGPGPRPVPAPTADMSASADMSS
jgi:hypothetical protein